MDISEMNNIDNFRDVDMDNNHENDHTNSLLKNENIFEDSVLSLNSVEEYEVDDTCGIFEYINNGGNSQTEIIADFDVPAQHYIETRLSRAPTEKQQSEFKALRVVMKHGPFSLEEDETIKRNFTYFCSIYDVNSVEEFLVINTKQRKDKALALYNMTKQQRLEFARILARNLNDRYLYTVYYRFRMLFTPVWCKGRYTEEEDRLLLKMVKETGFRHDKFGKIAEILGRGRQSVTKRYTLLTGLSYDNKVIWSKELIEEFIELLLYYCKVEKVEDLENVRLPFHIFVKVSRKLQISPTKLRIFWLGRLSSQLFCTEYVTLQCLRIKLIKLFRRARIKSKRDIQWKEVAQLFNGLTPLFLYQKLDKLIKHRVPEKLRDNFEDCIEYLHNKIIPVLKLSKYDRELRRCKYSKEKGLEFITEEE